MNNLSILTPTQFENLSFDLMQLLGLKNCIWRTPGRDGGRDIQGEFFGEDFSGYIRREIWYVECKRYSDTVNWPTVWEKIAYAESNCADVLFFITSSTLSPQAIDEVNRWNESRKKPSVRFWNGQELVTRLNLFPQLLVKYGLSNNPLSDSAVSILPLTKILLKYANTGNAYSEFGKSPARINSVIHALSELMSARIEEIETTGKTMTIPFVTSKDGFPWLNDNDMIDAMCFDKYATRVLLSLVHCHSKNETLTIKIRDKKLLIFTDFVYYETFYIDLKTVAFWGFMRIEYVRDAKTIEIENEYI